MQEKTKQPYLIFGGTVEGRHLAEFLSEHRICAIVCVATEYGEELLEEKPGITVHQGRLEEREMEQFFQEQKPRAVIDATHPYADLVTKNIRQACEATGFRYYRLFRGAADVEQLEGVKLFDDTVSAARWLEDQEGNILLTTGIKELPVFAEAITDRNRLYARVLLQDQVFEVMERYGIGRQQMICMQGPFALDLNIAMLKHVKAAFLVTKESGKAGGFMDKVEAARAAQATCVIIRRPLAESGWTEEEICQWILSDSEE